MALNYKLFGTNPFRFIQATNLKSFSPPNGKWFIIDKTGKIRATGTGPSPSNNTKVTQKPFPNGPVDFQLQFLQFALEARRKVVRHFGDNNLVTLRIARKIDINNSDYNYSTYGWNNSWEPGMNDMVGELLSIPLHSIREQILFEQYYFPFFCLDIL